MKAASQSMGHFRTIYSNDSTKTAINIQSDDKATRSNWPFARIVGALKVYFHNLVVILRFKLLTTLSLQIIPSPPLKYLSRDDPRRP